MTHAALLLLLLITHAALPFATADYARCSAFATVFNSNQTNAAFSKYNAGKFAVVPCLALVDCIYCLLLLWISQ